jgi:hypothetical protein
LAVGVEDLAGPDRLGVQRLAAERAEHRAARLPAADLDVLAATAHVLVQPWASIRAASALAISVAFSMISVGRSARITAPALLSTTAMA